MKNNPIYYDEVKYLLTHLRDADEQRIYHELNYDSLGMFRISLSCLDKLLSAYLQVTDDLMELQEVSE